MLVILEPEKSRPDGCRSAAEAPPHAIAILNMTMLRRQRTILKLLGASGGSLSSTQVQKLLFLLRRETFLQNDRTFYDFVPYKFGPYSFAASRELEALVAYGYVKEVAGRSSTILTIQTLGEREGEEVEADLARAVGKVANKYAGLSVRELMRDVYTRYPWFACKSDAKELVPKGAPSLARASVAVYTMGYETLSVDGFFGKLLELGIRRIIDVRSNPVSRKFGFAKKSMAAIAEKMGLEYVHVPELGIESERRKDVETAAEFRQLFGYYERHILTAGTVQIQQLSASMKESPSVLVCMEKEAVDCHRSRLATRIAATSGLKVVHL